MSDTYAVSFPALNHETVTQGHVDYCATSGHATHTLAGQPQPRCPRCGELRDTKPVVRVR